MKLVNFILNTGLDVVQLDELFGRLLLAQEILDGDSQTVKKDDDLAVQETLTESSASHNVKAQILRRKFDLTFSKLDKTVWSKTVLRIHDQNSLCTTQSDLNCADGSILPLSSNKLGKIWMEVSTPVGEAESIAFNVRNSNLDLLLRKLADELGGGKALASSRVPLENIGFLFEHSHAADDLVFCHPVVYSGQKPSCMVLQLRVRVAQEFQSHVVTHLKSKFDDRVNVSKKESLSISEVVALFQLLVDEAEADELVQVVLELSNDFVRLLLLGHCE